MFVAEKVLLLLVISLTDQGLRALHREDLSYGARNVSAQELDSQRSSSMINFNTQNKSIGIDFIN